MPLLCTVQAGFIYILFIYPPQTQSSHYLIFPDLMRGPIVPGLFDLLQQVSKPYCSTGPSLGCLLGKLCAAEFENH